MNIDFRLKKIAFSRSFIELDAETLHDCVIVGVKSSLARPNSKINDKKTETQRNPTKQITFLIFTYIIYSISTVICKQASSMGCLNIGWINKIYCSWCIGVLPVSDRRTQVKTAFFRVSGLLLGSVGCQSSQIQILIPKGTQISWVGTLGIKKLPAEVIEIGFFRILITSLFHVISIFFGFFTEFHKVISFCVN